MLLVLGTTWRDIAVTSSNRPTAFSRPGRYALALFAAVALALGMVAPACSSSNNSGSNAAQLQRCSLNSDCAMNLVCALGSCRAACVTSADCGNGGSCITDSNHHAVCQAAAEKNMPCDRPADCPEPLACASDYRCRNLCSTTSDCNQLGITGRVCATDANGVNYCADMGESMNGVLTAPPPANHSDAAVMEPDATTTTQDSGGSSGGSSSGASSSGASSSGASSSGASSSGASSSGGSSSGGAEAGADAGCSPACGLGYQCVGSTCTQCGVANGPCCNGTGCGSNLTCVTSGVAMPTCLCGGANQECCNATTCSNGLTCNTTMNQCVCGAAGEACCPPAGGSGPSTCTGALQCAGIRCSCEIGCSGSMVMRSDGSLWQNYSTPVTTTAATNFIASSFSAYYGSNGASGLACAAKSDGTAWCWGSNNYGQLGSPNAGTSSSYPVQVYTNIAGNAALTGITKVFVDGYYGDLACGINSSGSVWCWGYGYYGVLGNGYTNNSTFAIPVLTSMGGSQLTGVDQMSIAQDHICAHKSDGSVWCWGYNYYGQIGQGTSQPGNTYYYFPTQVQNLYNSAVQVTVGPDISCASTTDGSAYCWGYDSYGITGNGTHTGNALVPVQVLGGGDGGAPLSNISKVEIGSYSGYTVCAVISTDNSLWCWGNNAAPYLPAPYTESSNPVIGIYELCENGSSSPSFIDGKGVFHYGGSGSTNQISCP